MINFRKSYKDVIRGIHYDSFHHKVSNRFIWFSINQIVVNLREESPTFKKYLSFKINLIIDFLYLFPQWLEMLFG